MEDRHIHSMMAASDQESGGEKQVEKPTSPASPQKKTPRGSRKKRVAEHGEKIKKDLDKIMDEIDEVLEENAEEFIKSYVQRGGE